VWGFTPVVSALERLRQENHEFKASLGYKDPISKKTRRKKRHSYKKISSLTKKKGIKC
jgi:hypothetical protein